MGFDGKFRVHNVDDDWTVIIEDMDEGNLLSLKPAQQMGLLAGMEKGGGGGEITGFDIPRQYLIWSRGTALGTWEDTHGFVDGDDTWRSLPWATCRGAEPRQRQLQRWQRGPSR